MDNQKECINSQKVKDLKNNIKIIGLGCCSKSFIAPFLFVKYITNYKEYDVYKREKHMSTVLDKFDWYPKLLYSDDINNILIFKNAGTPVTQKNKPKDIEKQFNKILSDMESVNVQHNDIKPGEVLVDENNKIYLCDFGWASINNEMGCGIEIWNCNNTKKPYGYFNDKNALQRLKLV
tara:strand:+ start:994 stop:1527 length:534 start_codon:yes stop_codon:yes gene_type:complete